MTTDRLLTDIEEDEGCKLKAYKDSVGVWTIGYGHAYVNPDTVWSQEQAYAALKVDVARIKTYLDRYLPWWRDLDDLRQDVLVNMAFNMGVTHLIQFHNTLAAIQQHDWQAAHDGMLASKWAKQVGLRAERLALQMLKGRHA